MIVDDGFGLDMAFPRRINRGEEETLEVVVDTGQISFEASQAAQKNLTENVVSAASVGVIQGTEAGELIKGIDLKTEEVNSKIRKNRSIK